MNHEVALSQFTGQTHSDGRGHQKTSEGDGVLVRRALLCVPALYLAYLVYHTWESLSSSRIYGILSYVAHACATMAPYPTYKETCNAQHI